MCGLILDNVTKNKKSKAIIKRLSLELVKSPSNTAQIIFYILLHIEVNRSIKF